MRSGARGARTMSGRSGRGRGHRAGGAAIRARRSAARRRVASKLGWSPTLQPWPMAKAYSQLETSVLSSSRTRSTSSGMRKANHPATGCGIARWSKANRHRVARRAHYHRREWTANGRPLRGDHRLGHVVERALRRPAGDRRQGCGPVADPDGRSQLVRRRAGEDDLTANLAIGAATVGLAGKEGDVFRRVLGWSLVLVLGNVRDRPAAVHGPLRLDGGAPAEPTCRSTIRTRGDDRSSPEAELSTGSIEPFDGPAWERECERSALSALLPLA